MAFPRSPITPVMAGLSAALNFIRSPRSPSTGKLGLPLLDAEPLAAGEGLLSEKCELRIEGMTCGACVEVRASSSRIKASSQTCIQSIEGMLRTQAGIHSVKVALLAERGVVEYDPNV